MVQFDNYGLNYKLEFVIVIRIVIWYCKYSIGNVIEIVEVELFQEVWEGQLYDGDIKVVIVVVFGEGEQGNE